MKAVEDQRPTNLVKIPILAVDFRYYPLWMPLHFQAHCHSG
jgi:hypothetical protein